jgi:methyltransferase
VGWIFVLIFLPMLFEAGRASRNERQQRARGGVEPSGDVYALMQFAYPGSFLVMILEGLVRGAPPRSVFLAGLIVFAFAKALKWWAVTSLGPAWTFRVIVVPGMALTTTGPYRWVRHPNYIAVLGEFLGAALMTGALITGPLAAAAFALLIRRRIKVEEVAIDTASDTRGRARSAKRRGT